MGLENGQFCWRSGLTVFTICADIEGQWVRKSPKLCWRNIWMVPYPNFGNWWKVARVHLRDRIFFLKKGILWYPVGNLLLYVFSTIEASGTILDRYSRNLLFLMHYFRNFKPHFLRFAKGSFNNYVDRILPFFDPLSPCVDGFYTLSVDKNRHFLTPSLTLST